MIMVYHHFQRENLKLAWKHCSDPAIICPTPTARSTKRSRNSTPSHPISSRPWVTCMKNTLALGYSETFH
ncbi:hypothetical protein COOONC_02617 [Cooperia oncophora]